MRAGRLRHRVRWEYPIETQDANGDIVVTGWKTYALLPANVEPISGREFFQHQVELSRITHRVSLRFNSTITEKYRGVHEGKVMLVVAILPVKGRRHEMEILCEQKVGESA